MSRQVRRHIAVSPARVGGDAGPDWHLNRCSLGGQVLGEEQLPEGKRLMPNSPIG